MGETIFIWVLIFGLILIAVIANVIKNKHIAFVKENSLVYYKVMELNKKYKFYKLEDVLKETAVCKSKRGFDNFNVGKFYSELMDNNYMYYDEKIKKAEKNKVDYLDYLKNYKELADLFVTEEQVAKLDFKYKTFNKYEVELYKSLLIQKPVVSFEMQIYCYYTSPAGNSHYDCTYKYNYGEVKNGIESAKQRKYEIEHAQELKRIREEEKRKQQQILKEKLKRADAVDKREEELYKKEKEFKAATQGHIYSSASNVATEVVEETNENEDLDTKLRKIKKYFDNGELTYNEYKEKREKLLEE